MVGNEEDAVDSLATVMMLDALEDSEAAISSARVWMRLELERETEGGSSTPSFHLRLGWDTGCSRRRRALGCTCFLENPVYFGPRRRDNP